VGDTFGHNSLECGGSRTRDGGLGARWRVRGGVLEKSRRAGGRELRGGREAAFLQGALAGRVSATPRTRVPKMGRGGAPLDVNVPARATTDH